ncbi:hypothetical protein FQR65_LT03947 [Abscondita terminalis]|nr:hypothetical protein FQR65_LT03947 [Abscondita terminalis]
MWDIVFWEDQTVSYVPSCWSNADKTSYKFPNTLNQQLLRKYIHDCKDLISDFTWFTGISKKSNIESLQIAKEMCDQGQYTSSLETDNNENDDSNYCTKSGRRMKKRKLSTSESESSTTSFTEQAEEINTEVTTGDTTNVLYEMRNKQKKCNQSYLLEEQENQKSFGFTTNQIFPSYNYSQNLELEHTEIMPEENFGEEMSERVHYDGGPKPSLNKKNVISTLLIPNKRLEKEPNLTENNTDSQRLINTKSASKGAKIFSARIRSKSLEKEWPTRNSPVQQINYRFDRCRTNFTEKDYAFKTQSQHQNNSNKLSETIIRHRTPEAGGTSELILTKLLEMQYEIKSLLKKVSSVEILLNNFLVNTNCSVTEQDSVLSMLPLSTENEINCFHLELSDKNKFKQLIQLLYLVGGDTVQKVVFQQMSKILTNEVAIKYSGQGKKHKLPFNNLKMYDAVLAATRKRLPNTTDEEVKKMVGLFLATAKSRLKNKV